MNIPGLAILLVLGIVTVLAAAVVSVGAAESYSYSQCYQQIDYLVKCMLDSVESVAAMVDAGILSVSRSKEMESIHYSKIEQAD